LLLRLNHIRRNGEAARRIPSRVNVNFCDFTDYPPEFVSAIARWFACLDRRSLRMKENRRA
jgi:hypothetical protein